MKKISSKIIRDGYAAGENLVLVTIEGRTPLAKKYIDSYELLNGERFTI